MVSSLTLQASLSDMLNPPDPKKMHDYTTERYFTKEFKTQELTEKGSSYFSTKSSDMGNTENKQFKGDFNTKSFKGAGTFPVEANSKFSAGNIYQPGGREFKGKALEFQAARESGQVSHFADKKLPLVEQRYTGPELKVISKEVNIINETLKNKDDLKDQRLSIAEIREILNKKN